MIGQILKSVRMNGLESLFYNGWTGGVRTRTPRIHSAVLCRLSYGPRDDFGFQISDFGFEDIDILKFRMLN